MSGKIVGEVRYAPKDLTPRERFVLVALAESARDNGPSARVSRTNTAEIAELTGYSVGSIDNALTELKRRCLIYPVHAKARRGMAQDYRIVHLEAHHRAATIRPENASSPDEANGQQKTNGKPHPGVRQEPVDNSKADERKPHREPENASSPDEAPRKDSPVTTVSSNSSRQVTDAGDDENRLPPSLRSVGLEDLTHSSRAGP